ncbi:MAG: epoxyqueuosine reductase QueH [Candidatus Omnitrophica bacterium]|nr:epoxyqueuosine reductase QueH [Candidatus Omnitrophota bacterium]
MSKVLLHICCAGCATVCIQRLKAQGFEVSGVFYNPNIHPEEEYKKRKEDFFKISKKFSLKAVDAEYDLDSWFEFIKGCEEEKEGGRRCSLCFEFRLRKVCNISAREGFDFFATSLTISPHKNSKIINQIGSSIDVKRFLSRDFKKEDGFKESVKLSKELGLYRQNYCGCIFSQQNK